MLTALLFIVLAVQAVQVAHALQAGVAARVQTSTPLRLHTDGRWIKDSKGNMVILKGAAVFWRWQYSDPWAEYNPLSYIEESPQKYDLYKASGANFLRVQLNKWLWDTSPAYQSSLDTLVQWCKQRGIMVVLDFQGWHDMQPGHYRDWTKQEQVNYVVNGTMQVFMSTLARRYTAEPTVIGFEIMPEVPSDTFWATYRNISAQQARAEYRQGLVSAIRAIHSIDRNFLVFVYAPNNDYLVRFVKEAPIVEPNLVYCMMRSVSWDKGYWQYADAYYAGNPTQGNSLMESAYKSLLFSVMDTKYPVMLMETEAASNLPDSARYVSDLFHLFQKYQVGIAWWTFDRQITQPDPATGLVWLYLLEQSKDATNTLTGTGLVWAEHMKQPSS